MAGVSIDLKYSGQILTSVLFAINDFQGVQRETEYVLTDPCIHCKDNRFGTTNFGEEGMKYFFKTHRCNQVIFKFQTFQSWQMRAFCHMTIVIN